MKGRKVEVGSVSLAVKYRPKIWDDVVEQGSAKIIMQQQLRADAMKNAYLFCGPAGCGKTTCARIFAHDINKGEGNAIELDAASNNGVDDVRSIIQQARTRAIESEYKVFIIDECHAISSAGWQAMLKILEEPPAKSVFIFCTTDPQKIPRTILSRVQRYDFQRISQDGIVKRLDAILDNERGEDDAHDMDAIEYIAKIADGGMRDAITLMDKCLAYSKDLTIENVVRALGTTDYDAMFKFTDHLFRHQYADAIRVVEDLYNGGKDLKQFVKQYIQFLLDVNKWVMRCSWKYITLPRIIEYESRLESWAVGGLLDGNERRWLDTFVRLNADIKWSHTAKYDIEAAILTEG